MITISFKMSHYQLRNISLIIVLKLFCVNFLYSQIEFIDKQREFQNLKGNVKSYSTSAYKAKDFFGELKKTSDITNSQKFAFDTLGRVIHFEEFEDGAYDWFFDIKYNETDMSIEYNGLDHGKKAYCRYLVNSHNLVIESLYSLNDTIEYKEVAKYNLQDSLAEYRRYDKNGVLSSLKLIEYDANKRKIYLRNASNFYQSETKIVYHQGKLVKSKNTFNATGELIVAESYTYDASNKLSERIIHNYETNYELKTIYIYDSSGLLIKESDYAASDNEIKRPLYTNEYVYDKQKNLIEQTRKENRKSEKSEWFIQNRIISKYDSKGNKISEEEYRYYPNMTGFDFKTLTLFEYDNKDNLIKRTSAVTYEMSAPFDVLEKEIVECHISYYN